MAGRKCTKGRRSLKDQQHYNCVHLRRVPQKKRPRFSERLLHSCWCVRNANSCKQMSQTARANERVIKSNTHYKEMHNEYLCQHEAKCYTKRKDMRCVFEHNSFLLALCSSEQRQIKLNLQCYCVQFAVFSSI